MIKVALGVVILIALVGGIVASGIEHKHTSIKWLVGVLVIGAVGLLVANWLPLDVSGLIKVG